MAYRTEDDDNSETANEGYEAVFEDDFDVLEEEIQGVNWAVITLTYSLHPHMYYILTCSCRHITL